MKKANRAGRAENLMTKKEVTEEEVNVFEKEGLKVRKNEAAGTILMTASISGRINLDTMIRKNELLVHPNISPLEHRSIILIDFDRFYQYLHLFH